MTRKLAITSENKKNYSKKKKASETRFMKKLPKMSLLKGRLQSDRDRITMEGGILTQQSNSKQKCFRMILKDQKLKRKKEPL